MKCIYKPTESSAQPDLDGEYVRQKQHLLWMASMPGAMDHAKKRAEELDKDQSGLFAGIYSDVNNTLKNATAVSDAGQVKA